MYFLIKDMPQQQLHKLKLIGSLFALAALIELVGYSRSFALSQLAMALFLGVISCSLFLHYSKKTISNRAFMKHKKQEAFAYELLIPLFFGMLALISSIGLLFLIAPHKQFYVDAPLMLSFTIASNLLVSFALLKVIHTINTPKNTVAFGFKILVLAIPLLLSLATASSALFNDSKVLERLATVTIVGYIFFTSIFICSNAIKFLLAGSPSKLDLIQMLADLQAFEGIVFVNNLQAWTIASHLFGVKCEIVVVHNGQHPQQIVDQVTDYILQKYNIEHIIFDVTNQHLGDYYDV